MGHIAYEAARLYRFMGSADELGNYQSGRWRQTDELDRVSLTVGLSNPSLDADADALVAYDARRLAGYIQPVRYSPYPRLDDGREGFGSEKYAAYAGEGEVHLYAGCPTLQRDHVNILLLGDAKRRRAEIVARYGEAGVFY